MTAATTSKSVAALALNDCSNPRAVREGLPSPADRRSWLAAAYRGHQEFVWRNLASLGVPAAHVDDATQDVFMVVYRRAETFDPALGSMRAWLYGIVRQTARSYRRRARIVEPPRDFTAQPAATPDQIVSRGEAAQLVARFLETLDPEKRAVFVAIEIEGLTGPETAHAMGTKLNTIYSRLRLARERFETEVARQQARLQGEQRRRA